LVPYHSGADNQTETKLVESNSAASLDGGSTPPGSTLDRVRTPKNKKKDTDNQTIVGAFSVYKARSSPKQGSTGANPVDWVQKENDNQLRLQTKQIRERRVITQWNWLGSTLTSSTLAPLSLTKYRISLSSTILDFFP